MSASLVFAILLGAAVAVFKPSALWIALPFVIAWLVAPQVAYTISQPVTHVTAPLSETQRRQVRRLARRTWAFFEQFAGPDDHWLPPDHFGDVGFEEFHAGWHVIKQVFNPDQCAGWRPDRLERYDLTSLYVQTRSL